MLRRVSEDEVGAGDKERIGLLSVRALQLLSP